MLGGSLYQVYAIKEAVKMGYYVITCDYLPNNPGHQYAHEYYNVSTTDKEAVYELAKRLQVDDIWLNIISMFPNTSDVLHTRRLWNKSRI